MKTKRTLVVLTAVIIAITACVCIIISTGVLNPLKHHMKLAVKYMDEGKYEECVLEFNKAIEIDSKNVELYALLGAVYAEHIDMFSIEDIINLLNKGYKNTNDLSFKDIYVSLAEKLIETKKYNEALRLLNSGRNIVKADDIKKKIIYMYDNKLLEDVKDTINKEWTKDFAAFVSSSESDGLLDNYDCFDNYNERELIWSFISDSAGLYLRKKNSFNWDLESEPLVFNRVPSYQMDWVLKNYFNVTPSLKLDKQGETGSDSVYYSNHYYFSENMPRGFDDAEPIIQNIYALGNNQYYFIYKIKYIETASENGEYTSVSDNYYAFLERKAVDGVEFWSVIKTSETPINLMDISEKYNN